MVGDPFYAPALVPISPQMDVFPVLVMAPLLVNIVKLESEPISGACPNTGWIKLIDIVNTNIIFNITLK